MTNYVDEAAGDDCYALVWSYGMICVHCGCCSKDPLIQAKAKLEYHEEELSRTKNFTHWDYDNPDMLELQKKNVASDIEYESEKVNYYRNLVKELESQQKEKSTGDKM